MSEASWDGNVLNEALRLDPIREREYAPKLAGPIIQSENEICIGGEIGGLNRVDSFQSSRH